MEIKDVGLCLVAVFLRLAVYNLEFMSLRPELNSPGNSFARLTEERYESNQSIIPKAIYSLFNQEK